MLGGRLLIGDRCYSSWSMRVGLLADRFGIPVVLTDVDVLADASVADRLPGPASTVPAWETPEGTLIGDSLAIAEEWAARQPGAGMWPQRTEDRAWARSLAAEMHSGFSAIRTLCPMNLRAAYAPAPVPEEVDADLRRLDALCAWALEASGGPWLCGAYSIADAFFAPVAARIAGYGLAMGDTAAAYVARQLADPVFRRWRAMGLATGATLPWSTRDAPQLPWPGPEPLPARAVPNGPAENAACPYSGRPVAHFMETGGRVFGFCNPICRDKTLADALAWPEFAALYAG